MSPLEDQDVYGIAKEKLIGHAWDLNKDSSNISVSVNEDDVYKLADDLPFRKDKKGEAASTPDGS